MKPPSFQQLLTSAASLVPELIKGDGEVNLHRVARYCTNMGYPVSQATLHRHFNKPVTSDSRLDEDTVTSLNKALGIPRALLRGESMDTDTKEALSRFPLSTYLLAQKIQSLEPNIRESLLGHIDKLIQEATNRKLKTPGDKNSK